MGRNLIVKIDYDHLLYLTILRSFKSERECYKIVNEEIFPVEILIAIKIAMHRKEERRTISNDFFPRRPSRE